VLESFKADVQLVAPYAFQGGIKSVRSGVNKISVVLQFVSLLLHISIFLFTYSSIKEKKSYVFCFIEKLSTCVWQSLFQSDKCLQCRLYIILSLQHRVYRKCNAWLINFLANFRGLDQLIRMRLLVFLRSSKRGDDIDQGSLMYFAQFCQQTFRPEKIYVKDGLSQREIFFGKMISKISKRRWFFPKWKTQQNETKRGLYSELFK